ncbi:MAG TPA: NAD(P)-binding domain-containing protein [Roseiarcus sp.]|nr:NAD(P)-binding domain-containing protein [Roseiarcus sp.]
MAARSIRRNDCETVVIGAGPYGLAVAAHLKARGVSARLIGDPMSFWRRNMPKGMKLRSPWGATSISDPAGALSLDAYVKSQDLARVEPTPLETFVNYGAWFQSNAAPDLDRRMVDRVDATSAGLRVSLADGEGVHCARIVVAMGLAKQQFRPAAFANTPRELVSHTADHDNFANFRGKRVGVVGRGQSACETAALLCEAGAEAELICRGPVRWPGAEGQSASWRRLARASLSPILTAPSAVGPFPLNWLVEAPDLVRLMPTSARATFSARSLRAAAAGWLLPRFGDVRVTTGVDVVSAAPRGEKIEVKFQYGSSEFDHVVLATGYKIDIAKLGVLAPTLLSAIARQDGSPILSADFESTAPGVYFVGASAVASFGPLMRFIAGTGFAARRLARAIAAGRTSARMVNLSQGDPVAAEERGVRAQTVP